MLISRNLIIPAGFTAARETEPVDATRSRTELCSKSSADEAVTAFSGDVSISVNERCFNDSERFGGDIADCEGGVAGGRGSRAVAGLVTDFGGGLVGVTSCVVSSCLGASPCTRDFDLGLGLLAGEPAELLLT